MAVSVNSPQFMMDLESRMRFIQTNDYVRLTASEFMWWDKVSKRIPSLSRREIINWVLETASIEQIEENGGQLAYDTMYIQEAEYFNKTAGKGLKLRRPQFEDLDGNGVQLATAWIKQITSSAAYWPQAKIIALLALAEAALGYDKVPFFSVNHPSNPFDVLAGYYANIFTGTTGAAGANAADVNKAMYPGACDVYCVGAGAAVSVSDALGALIRAFQYIWLQKMPNGIYPRNLTPRFLLAPAKIYPSLVEVTNARQIASSAVGVTGAAGGGSLDIEALISQMGFGQPVLGRDLVDQESFYIFCQEAANEELGAFGYMEREAFSVRYYTGRGGGTGADAVLDIKDELEWHTTGRNEAVLGHPWVVYKVKRT